MDAHFAALAEKFALYRRLAYRIVRDHHDAEDCVQDAFVKAVEKYGQFNGTAQFSTWFSRIVINEALQRIRRTKRHFVPVEDLALHAPAPGPGRIAQDRQQLAIVGSLIDGLKPRSKTVMTMLADGLSGAEIARKLRIPHGTVNACRHRAVHRLRSELASS